MLSVKLRAAADLEPDAAYRSVRTIVVATLAPGESITGAAGEAHALREPHQQADLGLRDEKLLAEPDAAVHEARTVQIILSDSPEGSAVAVRHLQNVREAARQCRAAAADEASGAEAESLVGSRQDDVDTLGE